MTLLRAEQRAGGRNNEFQILKKSERDTELPMRKEFNKEG